jgi:integrase/recombinase XerD
MKNNSINKPYLRLRKDQPKKDGTCTIELCVTLNDKTKHISLKESCLEKHWDIKRSMVKDADKNHESINLIIDRDLAAANKIIVDARYNRLALTHNDFLKQFIVTGPEEDKLDFISFIQSEIDFEKKKKNKAPGTIKRYDHYFRKLVRYKSKILFSDLTENFLADIEVYMRDELGNQKNSSNNLLKFISKFLSIAVSKEITSVNPFKNYKITGFKNDKIKDLNKDELKVISTYYQSLEANHKHYRTLKSFLFCCYTGLRYGDAKHFTLNHLKNDLIVINTQKTKKTVHIPVIAAAKKLINFDVDTNLPNLATPCDQICNRVLKEVAINCKINKPITTHWARHTFASIAINLGIGKDTVQKILGHATSKQTDEYANMYSELLINEMDKYQQAFI